MAGIAAACEMILKVRGNLEGLKDTDNSKRTAAHLAAICGQAEVVNFLLERGGKEICRTACQLSSTLSSPIMAVTK